MVVIMESERVGDGEMNGHQYFSIFSFSVEPHSYSTRTRPNDDKEEGGALGLSFPNWTKTRALGCSPLLPYELPRISCNNLTQRLTTSSLYGKLDINRLTFDDQMSTWEYGYKSGEERKPRTLILKDKKT